jgi:hypothetical protein
VIYVNKHKGAFADIEGIILITFLNSISLIKGCSLDERIFISFKIECNN